MARSTYSTDLISGAFIILHWTIATLLAWRLMIKKKPIGESLAWLFVIYAMPGIGAGIYYAFGEKRQGDKRIRRLDSLSHYVEHWQSQLVNTGQSCPSLKKEWSEDCLEKQLADFVERATGYPVVQTEDWKLLGNFEEVLLELIALIDGAEKFLHLEFYIWETSGRVALVQEALLRARKRGVTVRILVDSIGSDHFLDSREHQELVDAGCEFEVSMKLRLFGGRWDLRNHRKILIADGRFALAGSMNMGDPDFFKQDAGVGKWIDAMMRVDGAGAQSLNGVFLQDWWVERGISSLGEEHWEYSELGEAQATDMTCAMQVLPSGPGIFPEAIHQVLMTAIYGATKKLVITTPYFVPGDSILNALIAASLRGVSVRLIVPRKSDFRIASLAAASNYEELLDAGVQIGLFQGGLLHTKSLTVDGRIGIFGTVNLDMRSFWLNSEVTMLIYDRAYTETLGERLEQYWEHCEPLEKTRWANRSVIQRGLESAARLLSPVL